jgi:hypothetical protein
MPKPRSPEFKVSSRPSLKTLGDKNQKHSISQKEKDLRSPTASRRRNVPIQNKLTASASARTPIQNYNNQDCNDQDYNDQDYNDQDYNDQDYNDQDYNDDTSAQLHHAGSRTKNVKVNNDNAKVKARSDGVHKLSVQSAVGAFTAKKLPYSSFDDKVSRVNPVSGLLCDSAEDGFACKVYPEAIAELIELSLMEADQVREAFKGRNRQNYVRIFQAYKDKLTDRDYSIIRGATGYLYENSRIKSINEETAKWMLGIKKIPASQIQSYTSKAVLEKIAKDCGLLNSGKKSEVLIRNIRSVIDSSK